MSDSVELDNFISNAIVWAETHIGSAAYAGRCLAFVQDAVEQSNHIDLLIVSLPLRISQPRVFRIQMPEAGGSNR